MSVSILIWVALWDCLAPLGTALEVNVLSVGTSIDDVDVDTLAAVGGVVVFVECSEGETIAMRDTSKTPWSILLELWICRVAAKGVDFLVFLDVLDLAVALAFAIRLLMKHCSHQDACESAR